MYKLELSKQIVTEIRTRIAHENTPDGGLQLSIPGTVVGRLEQIINQQIEETDPNTISSIALTSGIVLLITSDQSYQAITSQKGGLATHQLNRTVDYIETHLAERLDMMVLAQIAGLSRNHFGYAFRQSTGLTLRDYILDRRIARAKLMLKDKSIPIAQIALEIGFTSQSHFTAQFRRWTGIPPGRFRRRGGDEFTA